jgi:hypothetical protein
LWSPLHELMLFCFAAAHKTMYGQTPLEVLRAPH